MGSPHEREKPYVKPSDGGLVYSSTRSESRLLGSNGTENSLKGAWGDQRMENQFPCCQASRVDYLYQPIQLPEDNGIARPNLF